MCWRLRIYVIMTVEFFTRIFDHIIHCCRCGNPRQRPTSYAPELPYHCDEYLEICDNTKKVETEPYYRTVNREMAEDILMKRINGSCLVRPFKEVDICIKYVITIYAQDNFFHLYIRHIQRVNKYSVGLQKPFEKLFNTPSDIIDYYRLNKLLCINNKIKLNILLVPIS